MAIDSVTNEQAPSVFYGNDASVYMSQALAVADLLGTGHHDQYASNTVCEAGMLIFMLITAAQELDGAKNARHKQASDVIASMPEVTP